ncbi:MAG: stage II sporulation protein M [Candidatus Diapherotrites archaeon]|nr:stage II sporulation protein M [Candidatus Diapherotrites archaeon]
MVLESILQPDDVDNRPELVVIMALVATSIALLLTGIAFSSESSMLWIAFVTIALMPFMVAFFKKEEFEAVSYDKETTFMERNSDVLKLYYLFFFGIIFATALWYAMLPQDTITDLFGEQLKTVKSVQDLSNSMTGQFLGLGNVFDKNTVLIFENNLWVLILILITSFIYGAGALFIITWNASVIGVFIGDTIRQLYTVVYSGAEYGGLLAFGHGFYASLGFLPHGILELAAYSLAAVAGSILSAAIVRKKHLKNEFKIVTKDALVLIAIAILLVALGAFVEALAI